MHEIIFWDFYRVDALILVDFSEARLDEAILNLHMHA